MSSSREAQDVVRAYFAAFARRDADALLSLSHQDIELWAQPTAEAVGRREPYRGHEGLRHYLADVDRAWSSFSIEPSDLRAAGAGVIAFGRGNGRRAETGDILDVPLIWVFRLRDGLVAFCRVARTAAEARRMVAG